MSSLRVFKNKECSYITVLIEFYDKKTNFKIDDIKLELPKDIVFNTARSKDINEINSFTFEVTDEMREFILKAKPELKRKFEEYDYDFIGRHGLGPEYD